MTVHGPTIEGISAINVYIRLVMLSVPGYLPKASLEKGRLGFSHGMHGNSAACNIVRN